VGLQKGLNWMNFHNRQYDPQIGRFLGVDPLAAATAGMSSYTGMNNNPTMVVDPLGLQGIDLTAPWNYSTGQTFFSLGEPQSISIPATHPYAPGGIAAWFSLASSSIRNNNILNPKTMTVKFGWNRDDFDALGLDVVAETSETIYTRTDDGGLQGHMKEVTLTFQIGTAMARSDLSGFEQASIIVSNTSVVLSTIEMGTVLIKQSANYTDDIARVAKISSKTGKALGYVGVGLTIADGVTNGWKNHHKADVIIGGAQTLLLGAGPVGWGIGLVWLTADLITTGVTGKSITENLFD
jgi:RHS repeat-associated protein